MKKQSKTLSEPIKIAIISAAATLIAAIIGGIFLLISTHVAGGSPQPTPTSTISHTSTPIETFTSTPSPCLVKCVLYHADWSQGLDGWMGDSQEWSVNSDGILVSNGNYQNNKFLIAPYQPKTANYAVEAQIQFLKPGIPSADSPLFGVRLRGGEYEDTNGYDFYIFNDTARIRVALDPDAHVLAKKPYHLDTSWHTYRFEANNDTLTGYIDNVQVLLASDFNHTQSGSVGLFDINSQINVRNFTVFSL